MNLSNLQYKHYVVGFYFVGNKVLDEVFLIRKEKPEWQRGLLNGVGGRLNGEETPAEAMAREFNEESGYLTPAGHWLSFLTGEINTHQGPCIVHYLCMRGERFDPKIDKEQVSLWSVEGLQDAVLIVPNLLWIINMALMKYKHPYWEEDAHWHTY